MTPVGASDSSAINLRRASDRAAWLAPLTERFQLLQVVRARMQFQKRMQFALAFGELDVVGRRGQPGCAQTRGRRPQRIALRFQVLHLDEALLFQRPNHVRGIREFLLEIGRRQRAGFQQPQDLQRRIVVGCAEQKLARGVAAGVGERVELGLANFAGKRRHPAQNFAEGRAVILRRSNGQRESSAFEHRLFVDQPKTSFAGVVGRVDRAASGQCPLVCAIRREPRRGSRVARDDARFRVAGR